MRIAISRSVLAGLVLAVTLTASAQVRRVRPDPDAVAVLQGLQDAFDRKQPARYDQLLAPDAVATGYGRDGKLDSSMRMSRKELIKEFLTKSSDDSPSPFVDGTPISKRIIYASDIPGGQKLRVLMLGLAVPDTSQTVDWVMDLSVTRQGGRLMLTEMCIVPQDLAAQVVWPMIKEIESRNIPEAQRMSEAVKTYRRLWAKFALDMPKPEAQPTGRPGTTRTPAPVGPDTRRVVPPPPPPIRFPTRPTAVVRIDNPPPVMLPPAQVTARVRRTRDQVRIVVQREFPDFVGRQISEEIVAYIGRRIYISVFQNRWQATFGEISITISIRLVFVQPAVGPMTRYVLPVVEPPPRPVPPQPLPIADTPIVLTPPAERVNGCMVLTDLTRLKAKHGRRFEEIRKYIESFGPVMDLGGAVSATDYRGVDSFVERNFDRQNRDCLFIFGNADVVPHAVYPNPTRGMGGDPDQTVWSDDLYADFDHDAQGDPEVMIVRMPDDPGILADPNSTLYRASATSGQMAHHDYAVYGNINRSSPPLLAAIASPGKPNLLVRSVPMTADGLSRTFFQGHNVLINLHGSDNIGEAAVYWGEEQNKSIVTAMTADHAVAPDSIVMTSACYGASLANVGAGGLCVPKSSDTHIAMRFLRNGAAAYIGYTRVAWAAVSADALQQAEGWTPKRFMELTRQGQSPQNAFFQIKREMAKVVPTANPQFAKMYRQMIYLGLPPTGQRPIVPVATPDRPAKIKTQVERVLEKVADAARDGDVDKLTDLMTPTVRDGIREGAELEAPKMAERIVEMTRRPDATYPLADKDTLDDRLYLIEKTPENEYIASIRVPTTIDAGGKEPPQQRDRIARLKLRVDDDQVKLSGWESRNEDFDAKVTRPHEEWVRTAGDVDPGDSRDKYEELVEDYVQKTIMKAAEEGTLATFAHNPLAPVAAAAVAAQPGMVWMPAWLVAVVAATGGVVLLGVVVAVVAARRQPALTNLSGAVPAGGGQAGPVAVAPPAYDKSAPTIAPSPVANNPAAVAVPLPTDTSARRWRIALLGLLLIGAFFVPRLVIGPEGEIQSARLTDLTVLSQGEVPLLAKFLMVFPPLVGLAAIVVAVLMTSRIRGLLLFLMPWIAGVAAVFGYKLPAKMILNSIVPDAASMSLISAAGLLGLVALWVGLRARWYRPRFWPLYPLTVAGAAGFAIWQCVPQGGGAAALPVVQLGRAVADGPAIVKVVAAAMILSLILFAAAAVLALANFPRRSPSARSAALVAFRMVLVAALIQLVCMIVPMVEQPFRTGLPFGLADLLDTLRQFMLLGGMWLLMLAGLVDLIIGRSQP